MIYNKYKVYYYRNSQNNKVPVLEYIEKLSLKKTAKTPKQEIARALNNFEDYKINKSVIEYEKEK